MQADDSDALCRHDIEAALVFAATGIMPMKGPGLTPADLKAWQARMHFTFDTAAAALGVARSNYAQMVFVRSCRHSAGQGCGAFCRWDRVRLYP
jgi:hypothetical protein